jgi:hypothetical protein
MAAAAAVIGFVARDLVSSNKPASIDMARVKTPAVAAAPIRAVASSGSEGETVPQQFVLEHRSAHRVSVVGDFNNWNPAATPMTRSADSGLWSAILPLVLGRHLYGYMVDDSLFVLDPRMPKVRDPDFGTDASVLIVGRP